MMYRCVKIATPVLDPIALKRSGVLLFRAVPGASNDSRMTQRVSHRCFNRRPVPKLHQVGAVLMY